MEIRRKDGDVVVVVGIKMERIEVRIIFNFFFYDSVLSFESIYNVFFKILCFFIFFSVFINMFLVFFVIFKVWYLGLK